MIETIREIAKLLADIKTNHRVGACISLDVATMPMSERFMRHQHAAAHDRLMKALAGVVLRDSYTLTPQLVYRKEVDADGPQGPVHKISAETCVIHPQKLKRLEELILQLLTWEDYRSTQLDTTIGSGDDPETKVTA